MRKFARVIYAIGLVAAPIAIADADSVTVPDAPRDQRLPAYLIEIPPSVPDILIADADSASLVRFARTDNGIVSRDRRYMSVGLNGMGKQRAQDRKTPLGMYFITEQLDTSKLAAKYGVVAFVLDYPNAWDKLNERSGNGIWLHGVDPDAPDRPRQDTDGCLSLSNGELAAIAGELTPHVTPVIIARKLDWAGAAQMDQLRLEFRMVLEMWRASLEQGDLFAYLSLYDDEFHARGMDKRQWAAFQVGAFEARNLEAVALDEVLLLRDPEDPDLFLSRFEQTLTTDSGPVTTRKRIYWRRTGSSWRIVSEAAG